MQARSRKGSAARASVAVGAALLLLAMVALVYSGSSNTDGALVENGKTESQSLYSKVKNHESEVDAGERLVPLIIREQHISTYFVSLTHNCAVYRTEKPCFSSPPGSFFLLILHLRRRIYCQECVCSFIES